MLVSRKNLPLIHFVPCEAATGANVTEALHQGFVGLRFSVLRGELEKPFAEEGVEGLVLGLSQRASLFNEVLVGAESDILHEYSVHEICAIRWR
jgi:hypothetical protein